MATTDTHTRRTIAVDFDGVLHSYRSGWIDAHTIPDPPNHGAMDWLNRVSRTFEVVIFTTRAKTMRGRNAIKRWLWENGYVEPGAETWSDLRIRVSYTKPPALVYIDDRAWRFDGRFPAEIEILHASGMPGRAVT
jgi:hypothetical protein